MQKKLFILSGLLLIFLMFSPAFSSVNTDVDSIHVKYHLNPIVVTATRTEDTQRNLAASVSLIDSAYIKNLPTSSVLEAVNLTIPSIYITEWGVMGFGAAGNAAGKISVRGLGGGAVTQVLILRNGRPDFMGLMGCTIADDFSTDGLQKVEIIRGPASFIYGTNATGGVINLIPFQQKNDGIHLGLNSGAGSFGIKTASITLGTKRNNISSYTTFSHRETEGHRTDADGEYKANHATVNITYNLSKKTSVELNGSFADVTVYDPGTIDNPLSDNWYDIIRGGGDLTVKHRSIIGKSVIKLHGNFGDHKFFDGWKSTDRTLGFMAYNTAKIIKGNSTIAGFDFKRYGGKAENTLGNVDFGEFFVSEYGAYVHTKQVFLNRFILSGGVRVEKSSQFGSEIIPQIGLVTHITPLTSFRISAGKGFRSPSLRELYFFRPKNPDLKPEEMWNYEAAISQYIYSQLKIDLTIFRSQGTNMIRSSNPGFPFTWVNSGDFTHTGYELVTRWIPSDILTFNVSWSHLDPGNETMYSPAEKLSAQAVLRIRSFTMLGDILYIGGLYGADNKERPMDDYAVVNLTIRGPLYNGLGFRISVKNLFDKTYMAMYGYPMPGRYFIGNINYSFGK